MPPTETLSIDDAAKALAILFDWRPPEGVKYTVTCTSDPDGVPLRRIVRVFMSVMDDEIYCVHMSSVPGPRELALLSDAAHRLLSDAWDLPACVSLGADARPPSAGSHPVYDTEHFGRDS